MRILGIDPGIAIVGYGIVDINGNSISMVEYGCITTSSKSRLPDRLFFIMNEMTDIINEFKPEEMAIEELFFNKNTKTAITVAEARGVEILAAKQSGLEIYEYTPGFVHAKVFVVDGYKATVGTINLDYRSFYHHFECGVYLEGVQEIKKMEADFLGTMALSQRITLEDVRKEKKFTKILGWTMKIFAPLM